MEIQLLPESEIAELESPTGLMPIQNVLVHELHGSKPDTVTSTPRRVGLPPLVSSQEITGGSGGDLNLTLWEPQGVAGGTCAHVVTVKP